MVIRLTCTGQPPSIFHVASVLNGVSRDALMAKHKSNHIQVVYSNDAPAADRTLQTKAVFARELGINVKLCGDF